MVRKELHEENRRAWNLATDAHNSHKGDQASFFRNGGNKLFPEEMDLLGDVTRLRAVHLQCNAGQDTLSLARLGARVTGVDISDTAIEFARRLSAESGVPATFVRADVYDWLAEAAGGDSRFDVAFASYGALVWLSDIALWARGIAAVLNAGGRLVVVDYHPIMGMFKEDRSIAYPYSTGGSPLTFEEGIGDYVAASGPGAEAFEYQEGITGFRNPHPSHEFSWGLADVVTAMIDTGFRLTALREYPYSNGFKPFTWMRELGGRRFVLPDDVPSFPLMYGARGEL